MLVQSRPSFSLPDDHVILVDHVPQGSVLDGKAVAYDDAGSAFKAVETQVKQFQKGLNIHLMILLL